MKRLVFSKDNKMIDNITLIKNNLTDSEKLQIINKNNLQCLVNSSNNLKIYDNAKTKNLTGGIHIKIQENKLRIEGSVHKYFHYLQFKTLENYTVFTMPDFTETIKKLFSNFSIPLSDFLVINYEIGLNVFVDENPIKYLEKAVSVGNIDGTQRKLYINPKHKDERFLTTQMHRDNTLVFRIYDKDFERRDKGKKTAISNCLRIETKRTRQKNLSFSEFSNHANLLLMQNKFFAEWNKLNFDRDIVAPAGTYQSKKDLAKRILIDGANVVLKELQNNTELTPKIYRTSKEFVKKWDSIKFDFKLQKTDIEYSWAYSYSIAIQKVTDSNFNIL